MTSETATPPSAANRRRQRRWWLWPLITIAMLAYALVFGEFFLRLLAPQALVPRYVTGAADGVRANIPNASFRQWTPEVDVRLHYNAAGQRDDRPAPGAKTAGECRIALLGDSYFVGFESDFSNSFANQLEKALARRGHMCRTINFAVSGFGHAEMLRILDSRVKAYQPDVLLVSVHQTDGYDNLRANLFRQTDHGLEDNGNSYLPGVGISDRLNKSAIYRWAQENSQLYSALREWAGVTGKKLLAMLRMQGASDEDASEDASEDTEAGSPPDDLFPAWVANRKMNGEILREIVAHGQEMGAKLLLLEIPTSGSRTRYVGVMDRLIPAAVLQQIPHASPLERFRQMASPTTQLYLEQGHRHWTALGNRVAGEVAADALIQQHLLPQSGSSQPDNAPADPQSR